MKRTVRGWAYEWETGHICCAVVDGGRDRLHKLHHHGLTAELGRIVPCTITYDDGAKPKRRKKPHA